MILLIILRQCGIIYCGSEKCKPPNKFKYSQYGNINIIDKNGESYISITDMLKTKDGDFFVSDWSRNRNTIEFLEIWESIYNQNFNYGEFAIIKSKAGLNNYKISVKEWCEKNAIGITAKAGIYGGTYAHIAISQMKILTSNKVELIK